MRKLTTLIDYLIIALVGLIALVILAVMLAGIAIAHPITRLIK